MTLTVADAGDVAALADAPNAPTIPIDALVQHGFLEVTTHPEGAIVKIGDQQRTAPASFALPVGRYHIVATLDGWEPEERDVEVAREHVVEELAFMHRTHVATGANVMTPPHPHETGKLSARTTPWSEVYLGNRKLGDTPFADLELPVGIYQITFRSDHRPRVTKKVPIVAGKNTKVSFTFPTE